MCELWGFNGWRVNMPLKLDCKGKYIKKYNEGYNAILSNCGTPIQDCLREAGAGLSMYNSMPPLDLEWVIQNSRLFNGKINYVRERNSKN